LPICGTPESATITEGIRAGAVVLMAVAAVVVGAVARFGWRVWTLQAMIDRWLPPAASAHAASLDAVAHQACTCTCW